MDRGPICLDGYANFTVVDVNQKVKLQDKDMATKSK
jgi:hypothetical protein